MHQHAHNTQLFDWELETNFENFISYDIASLASQSPHLNDLSELLFEKFAVAALIKAKKARPRKNATDRLMCALKSLLWHLYRAAHHDPSCYVRIPLNRNAYVVNDPANVFGISPVICEIVHLLAEANAIELVIGFQDRATNKYKQTRIRALFDLRTALLELPSNIAPTSDSFPTFIFKDRGTKRPIEDFDQQNDPSVARDQGTLQKYNELIRGHTIAVYGCNSGFLRYRDRKNGFHNVDLTKTQLYTIYYIEPDQTLSYARKHGAFWQHIPSQAREFITIDNQNTVELDYVAQALNIAAGESGIQLDADPYDILVSDKLSKSANRTLVKKAIVIMLNTMDRDKALMALLAHKKSDPRSYLNVTFTQKFRAGVFDTILAKHPFLKDFAFKDQGMKLFRKDAEITRQIMDRFAKMNLVVLPIHDSFIVQARHKELLLRVMREVWHDMFGTRIQIKDAKTGEVFDFEHINTFPTAQKGPKWPATVFPEPRHHKQFSKRTLRVTSRHPYRKSESYLPRSTRRSTGSTRELSPFRPNLTSHRSDPPRCGGKGRDPPRVT